MALYREHLRYPTTWFNRGHLCLRSSGWEVLLYCLLGGGLWLFPLVNILHVESSAVVALTAYFVAGCAALAAFERNLDYKDVLVKRLLFLSIPLVFLTISLAWTPNCGYWQGLMFYFLFPVVTVPFSVSLAYVLAGTRRRRKRALLIVVGLVIVMLTPLYDIGLHPQFYVYNHVFGGILGPIYDEELALRAGLFIFRGMTLLWAWLFYLLGKRNRTLEKTDKKTSNPEGVRTVIYSFFRGRSFVTMLVPVVILGLCYSFSANLGFNTTSGYIQKSLGGLKQTAHFDIYYDPSSITREDVELLAEDHEYRYEWLQHRLDVDVNERIESYLYPDARTMVGLTGARNTNVSPVWLSTPQLHVLLASYQQVFAHELVHIFSREFGLPVLNVSFSVGLVEGLAVALEPPDGYPSPHELVSAAFFLQFHDDGTSHDRLSRQITPFLSPVGFWTGRGAVSYTTMGSFVRYLLDTYGSEVFKSVYAKSDFLIAYGKTPEQLAQAWEDSLKSIPLVSRAAADIVLRRFTIPSLFEKRCPHYIPRYRRYYRRGLEAWERRDTLRTLAMMERSLALRPQYEPALNHWSFLQNERGLHSDVLNRMETLQIEGLSPNLLVRLADTYAMLEDNERAYRLYDLAYSRTPQSDRDGHIRVILRQLLLDQPQMKQIVISGNSPEHRAEQMVSLEDTLAIGRLVQSLILAEAGRFDQAFIRLKETDLTEDIQLVAGRREALSRRRLVWLAQFAFRDGQLDNAVRYASRATQAYLSVGDWNEAARLVDFIDKMNWLQIERAKRN